MYPSRRGYNSGGHGSCNRAAANSKGGTDPVPEPPRVQPEGLGYCTRAAVCTTRGHQPYDILAQERKVKREFRTGPSGASEVDPIEPAENSQSSPPNLDNNRAWKFTKNRPCEFGWQGRNNHMIHTYKLLI